MRAMVWTKYGPPDSLQLREVPTPVPRDNEVLIKVHAATVTAGDCEVRSLRLPPLYRLPIRFYFGLTKPRALILGQEVAGEISATGASVTRFNLGDAIFGATLLHFGAYAEYVCLPEKYPIALKPASMTFGEAATIPTGGINALHFIRKANVRAGESVLIYGAGGSIGTYAVQIAKAFGAEVTCVDSAGKLEMLRSIGADDIVDYAREDFTARGKRYDVIIDVVGKSSFQRSIASLKPNGRYVLGNPSQVNTMRGWWTSTTTDKRVISELANYPQEALALLTSLIDQGKLKAVIDRTYPLEQLAEAHTYVETGNKTGNVVITLRKSAVARTP